MKTHRYLSIKILEEAKTPRESGNQSSRRNTLIMSQERRFKTAVSPNSSITPDEILMTDLEFFEEEIGRYRDHLNKIRKMDESIDETHIEQMEQNFRKVLEMSQAMMTYSKQCMETKFEQQIEIDHFRQEKILEVKNDFNYDQIRKLEDLLDQQASEMADMENDMEELNLLLAKKDHQIEQQTHQILNMNKQIYALESPKNKFFDINECDISGHKNYIRLQSTINEQRNHLDILNNELFELQKYSDKQKNEILIQLKNVQKIDTKLKQFEAYSERLKNEKKKLQDDLESMEMFTRNLQNQHKNEKYELDRKIQELQQDIQISQQNLSNARSSFMQLNSICARSSVNFRQSSEQQIEQFTNKKSQRSKMDIEESQNYYLMNSNMKSHYVEKEVIVEEIDEFQYSGIQQSQELRKSRLTDNSQCIYRPPSVQGNSNILDQSYHSELHQSDFRSPSKNATPQGIMEEDISLRFDTSQQDIIPEDKPLDITLYTPERHLKKKSVDITNDLSLSCGPNFSPARLQLQLKNQKEQIECLERELLMKVSVVKLDCATQTFVPLQKIQKRVVQIQVEPQVRIKIEKELQLSYVDQTPDFRQEIQSCVSENKELTEFTPKINNQFSFDEGIKQLDSTEIIRKTKELKLGLMIQKVDSNMVISTQQSDFKVSSSLSPEELKTDRLHSEGIIFKDILVTQPATPRMMGHQNKIFGQGFISPHTLRNRLSSPTDFSAQTHLRKDPNFEYFTMALISHKIKNQGITQILKLDQSKMFYHATQVLKLQFFEFHDYIEKEVAILRNSHLYRKHLKMRMAQMEAPTTGMLLEKNYNVYPEYF